MSLCNAMIIVRILSVTFQHQDSKSTADVYLFALGDFAIMPWKLNKRRVLSFWSTHVKPGVQALSHSFISNVQCFYTPRNKCSELWSQNNIPTNLSPAASTHSALVSTKCMPSTHIYRAGLNLPKDIPASAEKVELCVNWSEPQSRRVDALAQHRTTKWPLNLSNNLLDGCLMLRNSTDKNTAHIYPPHNSMSADDS